MDHSRPEPIAEAPRPHEWRGILLRSVAVLAVLLGCYVGVAYYFGDRVPAGTTVEGVDIGTLERDAAREAVVAGTASLTSRPVELRTEDGSVRLDPAEAGLLPDHDATLEGLTGLTFDPRNLWSRITGEGRTLDLQVSVDTTALQEEVERVAPELRVEPTQAQVVLAGGEVRVSEPAEGHELDVAAAVELVEEAWPRQRQVQVPVVALPPQLDADQVRTFVSGTVEPAIAEPLIVNLTVGEDKAQARISPGQLVRLLSVEQEGEEPGASSLRLLLDEAALLELVQDSLAGLVKDPVDASVALVDGRPQVRPAVTGTRIDDAAVLVGARQVLGVDGAAPGADGEVADPVDPEEAPEVQGRAVRVQPIEVDPEITDEDADRWQVEEVMAEFTSPFPTGAANEGRTENIRVGLTYVNGSVVMPGDQFSLADTLAPVSRDRGYVDAGVINDGRLVQGLGGGLSQVSTAVLNTAWFAGVQLDAFTPHSYYISRYPEGREATISIGLIDNTWTNDTDSPVVVQASVVDDSIVMRFWGDRQYTVDTTTGPRRDVTEPDTFTDDGPDCLTQTAVEGFTVTVTRTLSRSGEVVSSQDYTTTYQPSPGVTCTGTGGR